MFTVRCSFLPISSSLYFFLDVSSLSQFLINVIVQEHIFLIRTMADLSGIWGWAGFQKQRAHTPRLRPHLPQSHNLLRRGAIHRGVPCLHVPHQNRVIALRFCWPAVCVQCVRLVRHGARFPGSNFRTQCILQCFMGSLGFMSPSREAPKIKWWGIFRIRVQVITLAQNSAVFYLAWSEA